MTDDNDKPSPLVFVISGPSGVGKDRLISLMKTKFPSFHFGITATTRPRRPGETDGKDYFFLSRQVFMEMVAKNELLEWSQVYGNYYGVPLDQIRQALNRGQDVVLKVDVQGAEKIKSCIPAAVLIFVAPPSPEALATRLQGRRTERAEEFRMRLETSQKEMAAAALFDYVVVNDEGKVEEALNEIEAIIIKEKQRTRTGDG